MDMWHMKDTSLKDGLLQAIHPHVCSNKLLAISLVPAQMESLMTFSKSSNPSRSCSVSYLK